MNSNNIIKLIQKVSLKVAELVSPLLDPQPAPDARDVFSEIGVTMQTLKSIGIFSGSWVCVNKATCDIARLPFLPRKKILLHVYLL